MNEGEEGGLRRLDALGRVRTPASQRETLLDEFERSGISGVEFAALAGVKYQTFATWVQKRRKAREAREPKHEEAVVPSEGAAPSVKFVEAVMAPEYAMREYPGLILTLPGGVKLELTHPSQLILAVDLLRSLAAPMPRC